MSMTGISWTPLTGGGSLDVGTQSPTSVARVLSDVVGGEFPMELTADDLKTLLVMADFHKATFPATVNPYRELVELIEKYGRIRLETW